MDTVFKYLFLDVDGTMTDGKIVYTEKGDELKAFSVKDGLGISAINKEGVRVVVITGRESKIVMRRFKELGVECVFQGVRNKVLFIDEYLKINGISYDQVAYIGDDINDLPVMLKVGFAACPKDAVAEVKEVSHYVSSQNGGEGAVRDIIETIFGNQWKNVVKKYTAQAGI